MDTSILTHLFALAFQLAYIWVPALAVGVFVTFAISQD